MRILFVKESQSFPRSSGHDVHGFHMMQELSRLGHSIGLLTSSPTSEQSVQGIDLVYNERFGNLPSPGNAVNCLVCKADSSRIGASILRVPIKSQNWSIKKNSMP